MKRNSILRLSPLILILLFGGQISNADLTERYDRAAAIQNFENLKWVLNEQVTPVWIGTSDSFWYQRHTASGHRYTLVDAANRVKSDAFDHEALAAALAEQTKTGVSADGMHLSSLRFDPHAGTMEFRAHMKSWRFSIPTNELEVLSVNPLTDPSLLISPDGAQAAFFRDNNIWVRNLESGEEKQLTHDGSELFPYGTVPKATATRAVKPEALWSPDSTRLFTQQTDDRQVLDLPVMDFAPADGSVRPVIRHYRQAIPGDEHVTRFRMTAIDVATGKVVEARYPWVEAARMNDTPFGGNRAWWDDDSKRAWFVDIERGERAVHLVEFDTSTGQTRKVMSETTDRGYLELGSNVYTPTALHVIPEHDEIIWYSERSGWAHFYLYDLNTGQLKRTLTKGDWLVRDLIGYDAGSRNLFFSYAEKEKGKNPYYRHIARVNVGSGRTQQLSSSDADHFVINSGDFSALLLTMTQGLDMNELGGLSRTGNYYVETIQRSDGPTRTVLRDKDGEEVMQVEQEDVSHLPSKLRWPEVVLLKAADGETTIVANVYRPSDFSPQRTYPVIDHIYGGPQVSNVPEALFTGGAGAGLTAMTLAELGFIVVVIDGRGTAERSRAFHEASYGAAETASNLEDHIAAIRQLAEKYPYMDLNRVGITGFSGGGYMTTSAMLRFPDFFKVGVSGAGNHDQRLFWHTWGERYQGLMDGDNYLPQANLTYAKNFKGKMLFIHGLLDYGVHPGGLFQLTQALMNANKQFDLVLLPQAGHELPGYAMVRMWDYFVRHLGVGEPPADFRAQSFTDYLKIKMMQSTGMTTQLMGSPEVSDDAAETEVRMDAES